MGHAATEKNVREGQQQVPSMQSTRYNQKSKQSSLRGSQSRSPTSTLVKVSVQQRELNALGTLEGLESATVDLADLEGH